MFCNFCAELWCNHLFTAVCCFLLGVMRGPENAAHKTLFELKIFRNLPVWRLDWSNLYLLFPLPFVSLIPEADMAVALVFVDKYVSESYIWRTD